MGVGWAQELASATSEQLSMLERFDGMLAAAGTDGRFDDADEEDDEEQPEGNTPAA